MQTSLRFLFMLLLLRAAAEFAGPKVAGSSKNTPADVLIYFENGALRVEFLDHLK
jgi:hypothetical protein